MFDALALKATLADPTFTGTVGGITKAMVGLSNVDNTTDALKPVSTAGQAALDLKANIAGPTFTGDTGAANLTLSGYLRGPASFVIDPAAHGDETGTLVVAGNLQVDGTTTTINSTTVSIDDLNFSIATDAADSAAANGAGITIGGAGASLTYSHSGTKFVLNKPLDVTGAILIQQSGSTGFTTEKTGGTGSFINLKDNAGSVFIGGVNSEFVVQTPGSSYSNKLTISSGGDATFSGNVTSGSSITLGASNGRVSATQGLFGTTFCLTSDGKATFGSTSSSVPIAFAIDGNGASPAVLIATNNDTTFSGKSDITTSVSGFASTITNNKDDSQGLLVRTSDNDGGEYILDLQSSSSATGTNYASKFKVAKGGDATFSGNITVGDSHFIGDDSFDNLLIQSSSGENLNLSSANDIIFYTGGTSPSSLGTQRLRIFNSDGTATFKSGNNSFIDLDRNASGNAARIRYKTSGTDEFEAGLIGGIAGYHISDGSANPLLTIASTGALTINASANSTGNPRAIGFGGNSIGTNPLIYYDNAGNLVIDSTNSGKVYLNGDTTGDVNIAQGGGITYVGKTSNGGTQQQLYLAGYPLQSGSSFFGSYGFLTFAATTNYTGSARRYALTNAYAANKFAILQGGSSAANVGLGAGGSALTGTNPVFIIDGLGEISGDFNDTSDISLKKDIESLGDTTELVKKLNPVSFYWNEEQDKGENKNIGFIAQQVEEVVPELVKGDEGGKSINVTGLVSLLTKTVQEQQTIIEDLKARIETLEG